MSELVILVPVLQRPRNVKPLLDSVRSTSAGARVLFIPDPSDVEEIEALDQADAEWIAIDGNYPRKINQGALWTTEPLIFLGADDIRFHDGWLEAAKAKLTDGIGVVGTNDLGSRRVMRGVHSTHSLVTRDYAKLGTIDEPDKLLHEGYLHEWVDDELVATAKHRNAYAHAHDSVVEHMHPAWGKAPMDPLYEQIRPRIRAGRKIFREREVLWS